MQYRRHNSFLCNVDCVLKIYTQFTAHFTPCLHDVQTDGADDAILFKRAVKRVVKRAVYSLPARRPNRWSRRRHPFQAQLPLRARVSLRASLTRRLSALPQLSCVSIRTFVAVKQATCVHTRQGRSTAATAATPYASGRATACARYA